MPINAASINSKYINGALNNTERARVLSLLLRKTHVVSAKRSGGGWIRDPDIRWNDVINGGQDANEYTQQDARRETQHDRYVTFEIKVDNKEYLFAAVLPGVEDKVEFVVDLIHTISTTKSDDFSISNVRVITNSELNDLIGTK